MPTSPPRVKVVVAVVVVAVAAAVTAAALDRPVEVGLLHSRTGALSASELPVLEATELALRELNRNGGVLGRRIVWTGDENARLRVDCESKADVCAAVARELVDRGVDTLFGCWASACRKTVRETLDRGDAGRDWLLYYPVYWEGMESDEHIVYAGATAGQRILPAARWARMSRGPRAFLVGSDYIFSRAVHLQIEAQWEEMRGEVVGESWLHLGDGETRSDTPWLVAEARAAADAIGRLRPDVVLSSINGVGNVAFFEALADAGITADDVPVLAFAYEDSELQDHSELVVGHYTTTSWQAASIIEANEEFLELWHETHPGQAVSEPMVAAWSAVHLWAAAVEEAGSFDLAAVREESKGLGFGGPTGFTLLGDGRHAWHGVHVLRRMPEQDFRVVWSDPSPRPPGLWPPRIDAPEECAKHERIDDWWDCRFELMRQEHWAGGWQAPTPGAPTD